MKTVRSDGFTMVELVVGLAIVSILTVMAAPAFNQLMETQRAKSAATELFIALIQARSEAIRLNTSVQLAAKSGSLDWTTGWQIQALDATAGTATGPILEDHGAVRSVAVTGSLSAVTYRTSGRIQGSTVPTFNISGTYAASARCVCLNLSGRPTIVSGACTGSC